MPTFCPQRDKASVPSRVQGGGKINSKIKKGFQKFCSFKTIFFFFSPRGVKYQVSSKLQQEVDFKPRFKFPSLFFFFWGQINSLAEEIQLISDLSPKLTSPILHKMKEISLAMSTDNVRVLSKGTKTWSDEHKKNWKGRQVSIFDLHGFNVVAKFTNLPTT